MLVLRRLSRDLQALHDLELDLDVVDFLVDDQVRAALPGAQLQLPEQLFVRDGGDATEISLYIAPQIIAQLEADDPALRLHSGNLAAFCVVVEGLSHLLLLAWRCEHGQRISALELELQAEVDKFVCAWLLLTRQGMARARAAQLLTRQLFMAYHLAPGLSRDEVQRYGTASQAAAQYCARLSRCFGQDRSSQRIIKDLRSFMRRGLPDKLLARAV